MQDPFVGVSSLLQTTSSCLRSKPFMRVQIHGHWCISMKHHLPCAWSGLMRELHPLLSMSRRACRRHNNFPSVDRHRPLDSAQGISTPLWKMEEHPNACVPHLGALGSSPAATRCRFFSLRSPARRYVAKQDAAARARSAFIDEGDAVGFAPAILSRFSTWIVVQVQPPPPRKHIPLRIY